MTHFLFSEPAFNPVGGKFFPLMGDPLPSRMRAHSRNSLIFWKSIDGPEFASENCREGKCPPRHLPSFFLSGSERAALASTSEVVMERTRFPGGAVSIGAILLLSAVLVPRDAQAASVRIDYDVIGFTFAGPFSQGDITGGMISIVVPNATSTAFTTTVPATLTKLSLTGPSGSFSLLGSWPLNLIPFTSPSGLSLTFNGSQSGQVTTGGNLLSAVLTSIRLTYFSVFGSGGSGIQGSASGNIGHFLGIGSEVRTVVPEPTSGILLGLGLAGVGVAVGSGPALRRRLTNKS